MYSPNNNNHGGGTNHSPIRSRQDGDTVSVASSVSSRTMTHRYIPDSKYTLYNSQTDILQVDQLHDLHPKGKPIVDFINSAEIFWLDVSGATIGEWRELVTLLNIHPLT